MSLEEKEKVCIAKHDFRGFSMNKKKWRLPEIGRQWTFAAASRRHQRGQQS
jgi:hypothetical protein